MDLPSVSPVDSAAGACVVDTVRRSDLEGDTDRQVDGISEIAGQLQSVHGHVPLCFCFRQWTTGSNVWEWGLRFAES